MSAATLPAPAIRLTQVSPAVLRHDSKPVTQLKTPCSSCHLRELCLPCGMAAPEVEQLVFTRRKVHVGQKLYREGDRFQYIYALRAGSFKSSLSTADGREQISSLDLAGEVLGLDGLATGVHASTSEALEDSEVCAIPYDRLTELVAANSGMHHVVTRLMGREIVRDHGLMLLLGSMNAEQRLAAFLLNLSKRLKARGYSATEFHLRMTRADIGSLLGMKLETVSRTFKVFQNRGLLEVDLRHIRILDLAQLQREFDIHVQ